MLPPQLRLSAAHSLRLASTLVSSNAALQVLRPTVIHLSARSFWWQRCLDWNSPNEVVHQRSHRIRTLKTRAKLLEKIRRRGKFEWDANQRPFFTPKHIRWASHWNEGSGRGKWGVRPTERENKQEAEPERTENEENGYELSHREKMWREQMEKMRRRIEQDPYEAVFGKRFEPFWSPLVPSWMREEMGLQGWPKDKDASKVAAEKTSVEKSSVKESAAAAKEVEPSSAENVPASKAGVEKRTSEPASYSYASSTSWDSWSNRTRKVEWDSVSNETKRYEYDPISNRMVEIEQVASLKSASSNDLTSSNTQSASGNTTISSTDASRDVSAGQISSLRKAIPIPNFPTSTTIKSYDLKAATSLTPAKSTALFSSPSKPAALAKLPENDLDLLTADHVRASMGKTKTPANSLPPLTAQEKQELELDFDKKARSHDETDAILKAPDSTKWQPTPKSEWDKAETVYLLEQELETLRRKKDDLKAHEQGVLLNDRQLRVWFKLDERINLLSQRIAQISSDRPRVDPLKPETVPLPEARPSFPTTILQSSLERLQSKELPPATDPDDSAAHESTEPLPASNVPKDWTQQMEMLQSDRVLRTSDGGKKPRPPPLPRWIDDMQARKAKYEAEKAKLDAVTAGSSAANNARLEKANALLQAEIAEQKIRMQAHETRYAHKIRSLGDEVKTAYKQSTEHSLSHVEHIRKLEREVQRLQTLADEKQAEVDKVSRTYKGKIQGLRDELETAYKQSTVHSEKHLERIQALDLQLAEQQKLSSEELQRIAGESQQKLEQLGEQQRTALKASDESRGQLLDRVHELENELAAATATTNAEGVHRDVNVDHDSQRHEEWVKLASDMDRLDQMLMRLEKQVGVEGKTPPMVNAIEEIHPENNKQASSMTSGMNDIETTTKTTDSSVNTSNLPPKVTSSSTEVEWQEPPLYKVLAYDSGNDILSTAVTTSNVSGSEAPISIQQALSQLYQPARFVPHFADLQKEGYQVIHATKDLLVFKKVKAAEATNSAKAETTEFKATLEDHGLVGPYTGGRKPLISTAESASPQINPVDGTPASPATGNFASPTGFVNHDPVLPKKEDDAAEHSISASNSTPQNPREDSKSTSTSSPSNTPSSRPIRRQEAHFTGTSSPDTNITPPENETSSEQTGTRYWNSTQRRHHQRAEERQQRRRAKAEHRRRRPFVWALKVGVAAAGVMYLVGAATEKAREWEKRKERDGREAWIWRAQDVTRK